MSTDISEIKGIHPGVILNRVLKEKKINKSPFALSINEYPQTLVALINGKRGITASLSLRLGEAMGIDESYFLLLQAAYEIEREKKKIGKPTFPDISRFSDLNHVVGIVNTDQLKINYLEENKKDIITRVFNSTDEREINNIIRYYERAPILSILGKCNQEDQALIKANIDKYL